MNLFFFSRIINRVDGDHNVKDTCSYGKECPSLRKKRVFSTKKLPRTTKSLLDVDPKTP